MNCHTELCFNWKLHNEQSTREGGFGDHLPRTPIRLFTLQRTAQGFDGWHQHRRVMGSYFTLHWINGNAGLPVDCPCIHSLPPQTHKHHVKLCHPIIIIIVNNIVWVSINRTVEVLTLHSVDFMSTVLGFYVSVVWLKWMRVEDNSQEVCEVVQEIYFWSSLGVIVFISG